MNPLTCTACLFALLTLADAARAAGGSPPDKVPPTSEKRAAPATRSAVHHLRSPGTGRDPRLVVGASDALYMAYVASAGEGGGSNLLFASTEDDGDTFSPPLRVNDEPAEVRSHGENSPVLRLGPGHEFYAVWVGRDDIRFARSIDFGHSFTKAISVNDDTGDAPQSYPDLAVAPGGELMAVWLDFRPGQGTPQGTASVFVARSTDCGATFGPNVRLSIGACPCCRPVVVAGKDGAVHVAWRHVFPESQRDFVVASSSDGGRTFGAPVRVHADGWAIDGCPDSGASLALDGKTLAIAWYTAAGRRSIVRLARSEDGGRSFGPAVDLQGPVLDANHPMLATMGEELWVVFQGREPAASSGWGKNRAWLVRVPAQGAPGPPVPLPETSGVRYPSLADGNGGRFYVTFSERDTDSARAMLWRGRTRELGGVARKARETQAPVKGE